MDAPLPTTPDGPGLLTSPLLAALRVPHAFTTRLGGTSPGFFASLNFGNPGDLRPEERDPPRRIAHHWSLVTRALGCEGREVVEVHQVHGHAVHRVEPGRPAHPDQPPSTSTRADALVTTDPARLLAVRVADCAPVLIASADGRHVAAVHAGWRGAVARIASLTARDLAADGATDLHAAIGPCIGPDAFEVGDDVAAHLAPDDAACLRRIPDRPGKWLLDLPRLLAHDLRRAGVAHVQWLGLCTVSRPDLFFSHRRDQGRTGRMAGVIGPRA